MKHVPPHYSVRPLLVQEVLISGMLITKMVSVVRIASMMGHQHQLPSPPHPPLPLTVLNASIPTLVDSRWVGMIPQQIAARINFLALTKTRVFWLLSLEKL